MHIRLLTTTATYMVFHPSSLAGFPWERDNASLVSRLLCSSIRRFSHNIWAPPPMRVSQTLCSMTVTCAQPSNALVFLNWSETSERTLWLQETDSRGRTFRSGRFIFLLTLTRRIGLRFFGQQECSSWLSWSYIGSPKPYPALNISSLASTTSSLYQLPDHPHFKNLHQPSKS